MMPVAGVTVLTEREKARDVLNKLQSMENLTTYGIHKEIYIIAVLEGESDSDLEKMSMKIQKEIPGVLGIYPAQINFEDQKKGHAE
jgi:nitrate reductase NapAB chaperone NapD